MFNTPDEFMAFMKRFTDDCSEIYDFAKKRAAETPKSLSECLDEAANFLKTPIFNEKHVFNTKDKEGYYIWVEDVRPSGAKFGHWEKAPELTPELNSAINIFNMWRGSDLFTEKTCDDCYNDIKLHAAKKRRNSKTPPTVLEETLRLIPVDKIANIEISVGADGFTTVDVEMKRTPTDGNTISAVYMDEFPVVATPEEEIPIEDVKNCLSCIKEGFETSIRRLNERMTAYPGGSKVGIVSNDDTDYLAHALRYAYELEKLLLGEEDNDNG